MSRGKKRRTEQASGKSERFTHPSPFSSLKNTKVDAPAAVAPPPPAPTPPSDGTDAWHRFNEGVLPLDHSDTLPWAPPHREESPMVPTRDENDFVMAELADLVAGEGDFAIEFLDEYVSGLAPGVDHRLLRKLKAGVFSTQGYLDLHGFGWADARSTVLEFITEAIRDGKRCVLIVHGRGLHSEGEIAPLKTNLISLLSRGPLRRKVLAFSSARNIDGGPGALYILLRKGRTPHGQPG